MKRRIAVALCLAALTAFAPCAAYAEEAQAVQETEAGTEAADSGQVATAGEMAKPEDVVDEGMVPVYAADVAEGVYEGVEVRSSSSMFNITDCTLTVADGAMTAVITMHGDGYLKLFMGTGEEAVAAGEEDYIPFVLNEEGRQTYEVPVEALDMGIDCTAFSKKKQKWYDRVLVFCAASLPEGAITGVEMTTAEELGLADGVYTVEVTLEGGSGRTTVASPTELTVEDGVMTARIEWASPHYDYMIVADEKYLPVSEAGEDSVFEIPVKGMDYRMPVVADTVAMSTPHEISYTLCFDSATLRQVG